VGSNNKIKVDVRVIAATNRDLEAAYREGTFRKDLYFRLNVVTVHLPPLRERKADIPALVHWFSNRFVPGMPIQITQPAMRDMLQYDWPGNVRELENCIERAVALGSQNVIEVHDLPPAIRRLSGDEDAVIAVEPMNSTDLEELERETIMRVFEQTKGDKTLTGRMLGISRATLYRKLKRYNIGMASAVATTQG
jgi:DNA-binding NtrC family response regulator